MPRDRGQTRRYSSGYEYSPGRTLDPSASTCASIFRTQTRKWNDIEVMTFCGVGAPHRNTPPPMPEVFLGSGVLLLAKTWSARPYCLPFDPLSTSLRLRRGAFFVCASRADPENGEMLYDRCTRISVSMLRENCVEIWALSTLPPVAQVGIGQKCFTTYTSQRCHGQTT